jgi:hypothetical protein
MTYKDYADGYKHGRRDAKTAKQGYGHITGPLRASQLYLEGYRDGLEGKQRADISQEMVEELQGKDIGQILCSCKDWGLKHEFRSFNSLRDGNDGRQLAERAMASFKEGGALFVKTETWDVGHGPGQRLTPRREWNVLGVWFRSKEQPG